MEILEIGPRAAAALAKAASCEVVMEFSRGEVLRTDRGDIIWIDSDPEAFSPLGLRWRSHRFEKRDESGGSAAAVQNAFEHAIEQFLSDENPAPLIGLGHGLTPSGDDFLGGFAFVRQRQGQPMSFDTSNTHEISRARLAMHMHGEGTRAEVRFVDALLNGGDIDAAARILRRHGHSSGEDFMRGARAAAERR